MSKKPGNDHKINYLKSVILGREITGRLPRMIKSFLSQMAGGDKYNMIINFINKLEKRIQTVVDSFATVLSARV